MGGRAPAWPSARSKASPNGSKVPHKAGVFFPAHGSAPRPSSAPSARRSSAAPRRGLPTTLASSTDACAVPAVRRPRVLLALGHLLLRGHCLDGRVLLDDRVHDGHPRSRPRGRVLPALGRAVLLRSPGLCRSRRPRVRPRCPRWPRERHQWPRRRANEAPLPRAAKTRGRHHVVSPPRQRSAADGRQNAWATPCGPAAGPTKRRSRGPPRAAEHVGSTKRPPTKRRCPTPAPSSRRRTCRWCHIFL